MAPILAWHPDSWVKNSEAGDLRRHRAQYNVIVMNEDMIRRDEIDDWCVFNLSPDILTFEYIHSSQGKQHICAHKYKYNKNKIKRNETKIYRQRQ